MARCSVRSFTDQAVSAEVMQNILCAAMQAPSALGRRPWEFIVVDKPDLCRILADMSPYAKPAAAAAAVIINCVDMNRANPDEEAKQWWIQDMAACTENELIQIATEGLGGVWLGCYPKEDRIAHVQECLILPQNLIPFSLVALGYPSHAVTAKSQFQKERVHWNGYSAY